MRKALTLVLILVLCFSMIGCGKNTASKNTDGLKDAEIEAIASDEELDIDQLTKDAKEQGIKDVIVNDDGSITYIMSKSRHKEMMDEMQVGITETMDDLLSDEDFTSYKDIIANEDFTEFEVLVIRDQFEDSFDGFGILGLVFKSLYYQLCDGASPEDYRTVINMKDEATGEIFDTIIYPDAFDEE